LKDETIIALFGMGCSTAIAIAAMWKGIDTTIIVGVAGTLGTAVGYAVKKLRG